MAGVHHVHLWRMQEHEIALDAHIVLVGGVDRDKLRQRLNHLLQVEFGVTHTLLQIEGADTACADDRVIAH